MKKNESRQQQEVMCSLETPGTRLFFSLFLIYSILLYSFLLSFSSLLSLQKERKSGKKDPCSKDTSLSHDLSCSPVNREEQTGNCVVHSRGHTRFPENTPSFVTDTSSSLRLRSLRCPSLNGRDKNNLAGTSGGVTGSWRCTAMRKKY